MIFRDGSWVVIYEIFDTAPGIVIISYGEQKVSRHGEIGLRDSDG